MQADNSKAKIKCRQPVFGTCTCLKERLEMAAALCFPSSPTTVFNGRRVATIIAMVIGVISTAFYHVKRRGGGGDPGFTSE